MRKQNTFVIHDLEIKNMKLGMMIIIRMTLRPCMVLRAITTVDTSTKDIAIYETILYAHIINANQKQILEDKNE